MLKKTTGPAESLLEGLKVDCGIVNLIDRGFGFVKNKDGISYYLPATLAHQVMPGDLVQVRVTASQPTAGTKPLVLGVDSISRKPSRLMGEVRKNKLTNQWQLIPDDPCFKALIIVVPCALASQSLAEGDVVAVSVAAYVGVASTAPLDVSLEANLGPRVANIAESYVRWKYKFDQDTLEYTEFETPDDTGRVFLDIPFVTIDGEDTLDLDDAIYAKPTALGWQVQVAIADVASVVPRGSVQDHAARSVGTSLYLPSQVVPMLAPELSNNLCSLTPGVQKRAVVVSLLLDLAGSVQSVSIGRAWITTAKRLSYSQVSDWLAGTYEGSFGIEVDSSLTTMAQIYAVLRKNREEHGMLDFEDPDPEIITQEDGSQSLTWIGRTIAHKLVEEFMLLTNRVVATQLMERYGVAVLREQKPPSETDWLELKNSLQHEPDAILPDTPCMRALADLSKNQSIEGGPAHVAGRIKATMAPAGYAVIKSTNNGGSHFSLGCRYYTHFTSPIRRYLDLVNQRLLVKPLDESLTPEELIELQYVSENCTARSNAAKYAERYVWTQVKLHHLVQHSANTAQPLVARVVRQTKHGVRVFVEAWQVMAWVAADMLQASSYVWDGFTWTLAKNKLKVGHTLHNLYVARLDTTKPAYPDLHLGCKV